MSGTRTHCSDNRGSTVSGALLQMGVHFCLGIVESEVSALVCDWTQE